MDGVLRTHIDNLDHIIDNFSSLGLLERDAEFYFDNILDYLFVRFLNSEFTYAHYKALVDYINQSRFEYRRVNCTTTLGE